MKLKQAVPVTILALALVLSGCSSSGNKGTAHKAKKKQYGQMYYADGTAYTRTVNDNNTLLWYILWINNTQASYTSPAQLSSDRPSSSSVSWRPAPSAPSDAQASSRVVSVDPKGQPTDEIDDESAAEGEVLVTDETTTEEATADQNETSDDSSNSGSDGGSDNGSNGDSGGGGSDGGGGGDAGGGSD